MTKRVFSILISLLLFSCQNEEDSLWNGFDLQGHRGCRGLMPENSIEGMKTALDLNVKTLELDVVITADRKVILSHEPYVSAQICLDEQGTGIHPEEQYDLNIFMMTAEEVQSYDCGSKYHDRFGVQRKIKTIKPLLSDIIQESDKYANDSDRPLPLYNIETKMSPLGDNRYHPKPEEFVQLVYDVITSKGIEDRVSIQSFDARSLIEINKIDPSIRTVLLLEGATDPKDIIQRMGYTPYGFSPDYNLLDEDMLNWAQELGMKVVPWTVNDPEMARKLIDMGVDGLITDYPDRIKVTN